MWIWPKKKKKSLVYLTSIWHRVLLARLEKNPVMLPTSTLIDYRWEILHHTMFQLSDSLREEKRSRKVEQRLTLHSLGSLCMQYMLWAVTVTHLNEAVSSVERFWLTNFKRFNQKLPLIIDIIHYGGLCSFLH